MNTFFIVFAAVILTVLAQKAVRFLANFMLNMVLHILSDLCKEALGYDCVTVQLTKNGEVYLITQLIPINKCIIFSNDVIRRFKGTTKEQKIEIIKSLPLEDKWV